MQTEVECLRRCTSLRGPAKRNNLQVDTKTPAFLTRVAIYAEHCSNKEMSQNKIQILTDSAVFVGFDREYLLNEAS